MRILYFLAITTGLLIPTASIADTYDALCGDNDCKITINKLGFSGPKGFIQKDKISQWFMGGDEYNLALGTAGGTAGVCAVPAVPALRSHGLGRSVQPCAPAATCRWPAAAAWHRTRRGGRQPAAG